MSEQIYKFKNIKHSVRMRIVRISTDGIDLVNADYENLFYHVNSMDELEEVKWTNNNKSFTISY